MEQSIKAGLLRQLKNNAGDVKTESLLALYMENGLSADDFTVASNAFFFRPFSKDVWQAKLTDDAGKNEYLQIQLTRPGIYDQLPEGLFYQPAGERPAGSARQMAADYKANRQKEQEIRRFFTPLDHAFFLQRIALEKMENVLLGGLHTGILLDYFVAFWSLPATLPARYLAPFIQLLPSVHNIAGDLSLTARCLEYILQEPVTMKQAPPPPAVCTQLALQHQQLGVDMVMGNQYAHDSLQIACSIGPLQHTHIADYLDGGCSHEFLHTFFQFCLPADAAVVTSIEVPNRHMTIKNKEEPVLGYSSCL